MFCKERLSCYRLHPKDGEGNVFTRVCLIGRGLPPALWTLSLITGPRSLGGGGRGTPNPDTGYVQSPASGPTRGGGEGGTLILAGGGTPVLAGSVPQSWLGVSCPSWGTPWPR